MNIVMVLSGGSGTRFGTDLPKQYHILSGKPVIEYVLDACRLSKLADNVVVVASDVYVDKLRSKYKFPVVVGGSERSNSVKNGIDYIHDHYDCSKLVIVDAVTPLITEEQIDQYFSLLNKYDHVETGLKIVTGMRRVDGDPAIRDDYYLVCGPEAFGFKLFYDNFSDVNLPTTMFLPQLPKDASTFVCYDYPYSMKLTYLFDIRIAEALLDEVVNRPKEIKTMQNVEEWVANNSQKKVETQQWFRKLHEYFYLLRQRWGIVQYKVNTQSYASVVYEAVSEIYGNVIVKFDPPTLGRYLGEKFYYQNSSNDYMARLLDYDDEFNALLIEQIFPGRQIRFSASDPRILDFFDKVIENSIPESSFDSRHVLRFMDIFDMYEKKANGFDFELPLRRKLTGLARKIYDTEFACNEQYLIHFDLHARNILEAGEVYKAIDGTGIIGPLEFELVRMFIVDCMNDQENLYKNVAERYAVASRYFSDEKISSSLFVLWVYLMNQHVFSISDQFHMANWDIRSIKEFFFKGEDLSGELPYPVLKI